MYSRGTCRSAYRCSWNNKPDGNQCRGTPHHDPWMRCWNASQKLTLALIGIQALDIYDSAMGPHEDPRCNDEILCRE